MKILSLPDSADLSLISIEEEKKGEKYPKRLSFENPTVASITLSAPGVIEIESREGGDKTRVISGGIHGDEKAGPVIIDDIMQEIVTGKLNVCENLLLIYGNLQAMDVNDGKGARCVEPELGIISNLNRCFNQGIFANPENYAQARANQITEATERLVKGCIEGVEIHQSYDVPTVGEVRGGNDKSQYNFGMLFPTESLAKTTEWIRKNFSDIIAGGVITSHMDQDQKTFAGYLAQGMDSPAVTLEQGTIGSTGPETFTPQLGENLKRKISGEKEISNPQNYDLWEASDVIIHKPGFSWHDKDGQKTKNSPRDFMPTHEGLISSDGEGNKHNVKKGEVILFGGTTENIPQNDHIGEILTPM